MNKTLAAMAISLVFGTSAVFAEAPKAPPTPPALPDTGEKVDTASDATPFGAGAIKPSKALAKIVNAAGKPVGIASLKQTVEGVEVRMEVTGLEPGEHGVHFHEKGECTGPDFKSAGGHFREEGQIHGLENEHPHFGDLPNLVIRADGKGKLRASSRRVSLLEGKSSLLRDGGTSIMIHAKKDDQKTDPSGGSGDRIACGLIKAKL